MIVKDRELVWVESGNPRGIWLGDLELSSYLLANGLLPDDEYFKVKHQLVCTDCNRGVREQDDHHCSDPD